MIWENEMHLAFTPTKRGGGVYINGDSATIQKVERLLTRTAIESHICDDNGMCMTLSRYFEKKDDVVDWITLITGIAALRGSLGYRLSRENHALLCLLEYEISEALCKPPMKLSKDVVEHILDSLHGISDQFGGEKIESRMVYLYLLKTPSARKKELVNILVSIVPALQILDKGYSLRFQELNRYLLEYPAGTEFKYEL